MQNPTNQALFEELQRHIPGGVNSPFRAFQAVGGTPPVMRSGRGSQVWDVEGRCYVDFCCAWGPLMLGHSHPIILEAAHEALQDGCVFGASTPWELEFARAIREAYPVAEQVRLVNSGAEAVASALRLARGVRRRARIVKFEGCYHGHVECLDGAGQEANQMGGALALGASPGAVRETLLATFNDLDSVERILQSQADEIAAVIIEPIPGSMSVVQPEPGFLLGLRELCSRSDVLLIFDEVLSGCRVARGGAQELFGIYPDIVCLGKALAGGLPVGAFGASQKLMAHLAPIGHVYQAGTFCGNPLTVRCGLANLRELAKPGQYAKLAALTEALTDSLGDLPCDFHWSAYPGMFAGYFAPKRVRNHHDLEQVDQVRFARLYHQLLEAGHYLPPSCLDAAGISLVHSQEEVRNLGQAIRAGLS